MRQFVLENQPVKNGVITLNGKDFRYLRQVLRVKVGDMLNVRKKDGELVSTTVASIDDKAKLIKLQICGDTSAIKGAPGFTEVPLEASSDASITRGVQATELKNMGNGVEFYLFQFIPKPQKMELIVRQATECGITKVIPVIGEYSEKSSILSLQNSKQERIERIIREARQQSGSPVDTQLMKPMKLDEAMDFWKSVSDSKHLGFVLSERTDYSETITEVLASEKDVREIKAVAIACGSEGGISPEEIDVLRKNGEFHAIHFDVNILRCETAALYGTAAVQTAINEGWGK